MDQNVVIHVPPSWLGPSGEGLLPFYRQLKSGLEDLGVAATYRPLNKAVLLSEVARDEAIHLVNHGRFRHARVLNAGIAYIYPFWNVDPWGIRAFSSLAETRFDPSEVDGEVAREFFRRLRRRMLGEGRSRYPQPDRGAPLPDGAAAVFLQSEAHRDVDETCNLDRQSMVDAVLHAWDGPVIIKPHPRDKDPETVSWLNGLARKHDRLTLSVANIHDILAAAAKVVTINSAVGVEAYLHRRPVILCGQSDFHHIAHRATSADGLANALAAPVRKRAYDKFIYWYFGLQCLSTTQPDLAERFLDRARANLTAGQDPVS